MNPLVVDLGAAMQEVPPVDLDVGALGEWWWDFHDNADGAVHMPDREAALDPRQHPRRMMDCDVVCVGDPSGPNQFVVSAVDHEDEVKTARQARVIGTAARNASDWLFEHGVGMWIFSASSYEGYQLNIPTAQQVIDHPDPLKRRYRTFHRWGWPETFWSHPVPGRRIADLSFAAALQTRLFHTFGPRMKGHLSLHTMDVDHRYVWLAKPYAEVVDFYGEAAREVGYGKSFGDPESRLRRIAPSVYLHHDTEGDHSQRDAFAEWWTQGYTRQSAGAYLRNSVRGAQNAQAVLHEASLTSIDRAVALNAKDVHDALRQLAEKSWKARGALRGSEDNRIRHQAIPKMLNFSSWLIKQWQVPSLAEVRADPHSWMASLLIRGRPLGILLRDLDSRGVVVKGSGWAILDDNVDLARQSGALQVHTDNESTGLTAATVFSVVAAEVGAPLRLITDKRNELRQASPKKDSLVQVANAADSLG